AKRKPRRVRDTGRPSPVNWYFMRVCTGIEGVCPPLCTWAQLKDGTISLAEVEQFHFAMEELQGKYIEAINNARNSPK
ncbi:hypothetical protein LLE78_12640, partial [Staphylococcus haemolyticus]|uniref:hypothetical protein n=1 Tax=Staphylococcus haemolyticus TaxID=1283 RepID=UPI001D158894